MFSYYIGSDSMPVNSGSDIWVHPFPKQRNCTQIDTYNSSDYFPFTYGDYFLAITQCLQKKNFSDLLDALYISTMIRFTLDAIHHIDIYLEKHGRLYHPARVKLIVTGHEMTFALNVACSSETIQCLKQEYEVLKQLMNQRAILSKKKDLPCVYWQSDHFLHETYPISMFLAEWFDGYHEFHMSNPLFPSPQPSPNEGEGVKDAENLNTKPILVWDTINGNVVLNSDQVLDMYRQCAYILTMYYHIDTCSQIYPWHHAAGDFVIKILDTSTVSVKLITARNYGPILSCATITNDIRIEALLFFLINLSIRMRLDRINGIEDIDWADNDALKGTIQGFFDALIDKQTEIHSLELTIQDIKNFFLSCCDVNYLYEMTTDILNSYHPNAPDIAVIKKHMHAHLLVLSELLICYSTNN
ncbi:MAG: hypothetical protein HQK77_05135 [Desulfobacterales bacterium]|nr:hypothetical protein [Desulfobacterales bacterium]